MMILCKDNGNMDKKAINCACSSKCMMDDCYLTIILEKSLVDKTNIYIYIYIPCMWWWMTHGVIGLDVDAQSELG